MSWIAIVLGLFLFYQFVERRHKIVLLKIAGLLVLVGGVSVGGFFAYEFYKDQSRGQGLSVELTGKDLKLEKTLTKKIVDDVFEGMSNTISEYYPNLSSADREGLKQYLFESYLAEPNAWEDVPWAMSEEEFNVLINWFPNKSSEIEAKLRSLQEPRQNKFFLELPDRRLKAVTLYQKLRHYQALVWVENSFAIDELKNRFSEKMLPEERRGMESLSPLKDAADEELFEAINKRRDLKTQMSFKVCNKRSTPLQSYSFRVSGFMKGRSTAQAVRQGSDSDVSSAFNSDIIVGANSCSGVEWTGPYKFFSRYDITGVEGNW